MKHTKDCIETCKKVLLLLEAKNWEDAERAITHGFNWSDQPEGFAYWQKIIGRIIEEEYV